MKEMSMPEEETNRGGGGLPAHFLLLISLFCLATGQLVVGTSLEPDREVLLQLKSFLEDNNRITKGLYSERANSSKSSPCDWLGIACSSGSSRVIGIDISSSRISGVMFENYSALTELSTLDLSNNSISGWIPPDLNRCRNLRYLDLSRNILDAKTQAMPSLLFGA